MVPSKRVDALDENDELGAAELAEKPRREQRDLVAGLELALVLEPALLGPRRQVQREHEDRGEERERKPHDRTQPRGERLPRAEPHDHLAVAVPAGEREQHGHEHRDREQDVEVEERVEPEQRQDAFRRDRSPCGPRQQPQHEIGEQDGHQDEEQPDGGRRHLADETAPENHDACRILTFLAGFADNANYCALRQRKPIAGG